MNGSHISICCPQTKNIKLIILGPLSKFGVAGITVCDKLSNFKTEDICRPLGLYVIGAPLLVVMENRKFEVDVVAKWALKIRSVPQKQAAT